MAEKSSNKQNPFDVKSIHELVRLMTKHSLSELDLQDGDKKIRMKRDSGIIPVQVPVAGMPLPADTKRNGTCRACSFRTRTKGQHSRTFQPD